MTSAARRVRSGDDIVSEGEGTGHVHFVASGTACRYKLVEDGRRAIVALLLPGDFCDLHVAILDEMDHSIGALTDCEVASIPTAELLRMLDQYPSINRACLWATLVDEAVLREWLVNIGRHSSEKNLAHLFCEIYVRLHTVGLTEDHSYWMPFTQQTLGDLLGITPVHVQRTMSRLRGAELISQQGGHIRLLDFDALAELGEFDRTYLNLGKGSGP
ncbi:Crp/Fnr family transcriptional regulator [Roseivivax sp. CAU 1761]